MLSHITQVHGPERARDRGGSNWRHDPDADGIQRFLRPGSTSCTAMVTPVSHAPVPKG